MKTALAIVLLGGLGLLWGIRPATVTEPFTVRLIRGSDVPSSSVDGPLKGTLARRLGLVFKWRHYQELAIATAAVRSGDTASVGLDRGVKVDIRLLAGGAADYTVSIHGRVVSRATRVGGKNGPWLAGMEARGAGSEALFVLVQRATPAPALMTWQHP